MSDEREFEDFVALIRKEIIEKSMGDAGEGNSFEEDAFTAVVLDHLEEEEGLEEPQVCRFTEGRAKTSGKINGYALSSSKEDVTLFISLYHAGDAPESIAPSELRKSFDRLRRVFEQAVEGHYKDRDHGHEDYDMFQKLYEARDTIRDVRLCLLTNDLCGDFRGTSSKAGEYSFSQHVWDIKRMFRCFGGETPRGDIVVDFQSYASGPLQCLPMPARAEGYESYLAIFPGHVLADLYENFGERLLERNVRSFLETRGKVNKGIRDTVLNRPDHFFAYNNGISVVVDDLDVIIGRNGGAVIRQIRGMQIVNGGQTTASLYRARTRDGARLDGIFVQAKISKVNSSDAEQIVHQISRCSNSQNSVNDADFYANDSFHIDLEKLSRTVWDPTQTNHWFYERARGQYQVQKMRAGSSKAKIRKFELLYPPRQRFDKTKLGLYANAWDQLPHIVCTGGQKNFLKFMDRVKARETDPVQTEADFRRLVAKIILFRDVERAIREVKEIQGYRSQLAAYIVALLSSGTEKKLDLDRVWKQQTMAPPTRALVLKHAKAVHDRIVESAQGRNVSEWCKKLDCWKRIDTDFKGVFASQKK